MYMYNINTTHTESMRHARQVDKIQKNVVDIPNRVREQIPCEWNNENRDKMWKGSKHGEYKTEGVQLTSSSCWFRISRSRLTASCLSDFSCSLMSLQREHTTKLIDRTYIYRVTKTRPSGVLVQVLLYGTTKKLRCSRDWIANLKLGYE